MMRTLVLILTIMTLSQLLYGQSTLDTKIALAVEQLKCAEPANDDPVKLSACLITESDSLAVIMKVKIAPEWHIYQYVPGNLPYIALEEILQLPSDTQPVGKWMTSKPAASANDPGVLIFENEAWFVQKAIRKSKEKAVMKVGLYYQTCDLKQCLQPTEKNISIQIN